MIPATIRTNNPGAQYPGPSARKFGSTGTETIGGGHLIAVFPDMVAGAAAMFDLLAARYTGKSLQATIATWSGGNSVETYLQVIQRDTGLQPTDLLTAAMIRDPAKAVPIAKAMAWQEAGREYPMTDDLWRAAHARAFAPVSAADRPAVPSEVVAAGSRKWSLLRWLQGLLGLGAGSSALGLTAPDLPQSVSAIKTLAETAQSVGPGTLGVALLLFVVVFAGLEAIKHLMVQDAAEGRYTPSKTEART